MLSVISKRVLLTTAVILTISACQSTPNRPFSTAEEVRNPSVLRLEIERSLAIGDLITADQLLGQLAELEPEDYLLLGRLCAAQKNHRCAADALIQVSLALGMDSEELPADINDQIWLALTRAQHGPDTFSHRYHLAWWQLQQSVRQATSVSEQHATWLAWQTRNPSHPATIRPPKPLQQLNNYRTPNIAVLLPLSGRLASAGKAIQEAMIAAYLEESGLSENRLDFYDTDAAPLPNIWESILETVPGVVVGPLRKDRAEAFAQLTAFSELPRLALNYLSKEHVSRGPFYQLGIAIEDEAGSLVNFVLLSGLEKVAIVMSSDAWAERAKNAFLAQWPYLATQAQFANAKELTEAVGVAMQIAGSETRRQEIANIIGQKVEFLPRARQDLEAVVALTNNAEARALVPALKFHFGDHLPVYATSQAARRGSLADLKGFYLAEMPLFVDAVNHRDFLTTFNLRDNPLAELYALGFDAYKVASWLPVLTPQSKISMAGSSGYLWLDQDGVFRRELHLTQVNEEGALTSVEH
jgi:outer membrane PBP1 activator LpoA protein